ncbi:MAG: Arylsulfatase A [Parcubacteria group bacterium Gr01-1014_8]|nr:MAG: Arylsulfatase A [Parcubacteria group bacterium Gr01-1014_8]
MQRISALLLVLVLGSYAMYYAIPEDVSNVSCDNCNLVIITLDSVRLDHMALYGYERSTTPNIDNFGQGALVFTNYFSTSYLTPVSAFSMLTGRYPFSNGVVSFYSYLRDDVTSLAETLQAEGYRAAAFGSSPEYELFPSLKESGMRGFDVYKTFTSDDPDILPSRSQVPVEEAIAWAEDSSQPFFLWMPIGAAHWPYDPFEERTFTDAGYDGFLRNLPSGFKTYSQIYKGTYYPIREGTMPNVRQSLHLPEYSSRHTEEVDLLLEWGPSATTSLNAEDLEYVRGRYDDGLLFMDRIVGDIIATLEEKHLDRDTIIIIESVHGEELGERGVIGHYDIDEATIRSPLMIKVPGARSRRIDALISGVDIYPTALSMLGIDMAMRDGIDFVPFLSGVTSTEPRQEVFLTRTPLFETLYTVEGDSMTSARYERLRSEDARMHYHDSAIRTNEWKLIHRTSRVALSRYSWWQYLTGNIENIPEYELYFLLDDPLETTNLYNERPDIATPLQERLSAWENTQASDRNLLKMQDTIRQEYF